VSEPGTVTTAFGGGAARGLRRGLEALAQRASRVLSARAQARLEISLRAAEASAVSGLAAELGARERCAVLDLAGGGAHAFVLLSRPLAFALLELRFGADRRTLGGEAPDRAYTRIEERALEQTARELWAALCAGAGGALAAAAGPCCLDDAQGLRERDEAPLWLARFAVTGLSREEQLVVGIPRTAAAGGERPAANGSRDAR